MRLSEHYWTSSGILVGLSLFLFFWCRIFATLILGEGFLDTAGIQRTLLSFASKAAPDIAPMRPTLAYEQCDNNRWQPMGVVVTQWVVHARHVVLPPDQCQGMPRYAKAGPGLASRRNFHRHRNDSASSSSTFLHTLSAHLYASHHLSLHSSGP